VAEKDLKEDDPFEFVAVRFPVAEGVDADEVMARVFIEEYALMGMPRRNVRRLFESPAFAGSHAVLEARGAPFVDRILDSVFGPEAPQEVPDGSRL